MMMPMERPVAAYRIAEQFVFTPSDRRVRAGAETWFLKPKPHEVLAELVHRPQEVISREELHQKVWEGITVAPDSLESCVAQLRRIFKDDARSPKFIETVHGVGYRFIATVERVMPVLEAAPLAAATQPAAARVEIWPVPWACCVIITAIALRLWLADPPSPAELAWWRFDDTGASVMDSSGNGNGGKAINGVLRATGPLGGAVALDGVGGHVVGTSPGQLPLGDMPRTITALLKVEQPPGTDVNIFHYGSSTARLPAANLHLLLTPSGSLAFGNGYGFGTIQGGPPLIDGRWHFAAGVYHGDAKARIFLDGSEVKAGTLKQRPDTGAASNWTIGLFMGGGQPLKGVIDDVRVYGGSSALHRDFRVAPPYLPRARSFARPARQWLSASDFRLRARRRGERDPLRRNGPLR